MSEHDRIHTQPPMQLRPNEHLPRNYQKTQIFLSIAAELSDLGTCDRNRVGALIVKDGRCVTWGYNGAPPSMDHCDKNMHGWANPAHDAVKVNSLSRREDRERWAAEQLATYGCRNATHAEANALAFAARHGIPTDGATLYVTMSPCEVCARLLIAAGIVQVVYAKEYRKSEGILILQAAGVKCLG